MQAALADDIRLVLGLSFQIAGSGVMRAVQIARIGLPAFALRMTETPSPVAGPGQARIRVRAFGINFADILARTGMYPEAPRLPFTPGYEVAGEVIDVVGDCKVIQPGMRVAALVDLGAYAEEAVAQCGACVALPDGMGWEEAAAIPVNGTTAWLALREMTCVRAGDRVLIHSAAGGVGSMAVQLALEAGCEVFGTVGSPSKLAFLQDLGVHHPLCHDTMDVEAEVDRLTDGQGLDVVLDSLGGPAIASGLRMLAPSGRLVSIGIASMTPANRRTLLSSGMGLLKAPILHPYALLDEGKGFIGINLRRTATARPARVTRALRSVFALAASGRIRPRIDSIHPFEDCAAAHERLHGRRSLGKVVVRVDPAA